MALRSFHDPESEESLPSSLFESTYHALLVAVQEYDDYNINDLEHPIEDARRLSEVLIEDYLFEEDHIMRLENPDRDEIIENLEGQATIVKPEDHFLVFFAGHGYWDPDRKQGYWLPQNARQKSRSNWISNSDVRDLIVGIRCRHTLLVSDACFSGGIFKTRKAFMNSDRGLDRLFKLPSRKAMTSGTLKEVPDESVFLHYLTDRLKKNENTWITSERLFVDLKEPVMNNGPNVPQYGTIHGAGDEGGDFVFLRREKEPVVEEIDIEQAQPEPADPISTEPAEVISAVDADPSEELRVEDEDTHQPVDAVPALMHAVTEAEEKEPAELPKAIVDPGGPNEAVHGSNTGPVSKISPGTPPARTSLPGKLKSPLVIVVGVALMISLGFFVWNTMKKKEEQAIYRERYSEFDGLVFFQAARDHDQVLSLLNSHLDNRKASSVDTPPGQRLQQTSVTYGTGEFSLNQLVIYYDFFQTVRFELMQGRTLSKEFASDASNVMLSESGCRIINCEIGNQITVNGKEGEIIGIVRDAYYGAGDESFPEISDESFPGIYYIDPAQIRWIIASPRANVETKDIEASLSQYYGTPPRILSIDDTLEMP